MRMAMRNKRRFLYRNLQREPEGHITEDGLYTGEQTRAFEPVREGYANISPATGSVREAGFGADIEYDRVLCAETDFGMTEQSQLWVDDLDADAPDYVVRRIARSESHVRIAIAKVNIG